MKREIKFRLWDSKSHEWFIKGEDGIVGNMVCCDSWDMFDPDDYVWCQYTGLKDKNGREIYEGDIVRVAGVTDPGMKWVVTWANASWELHHVLGGKYMTPMRLGTMSVPVEIIGNVHEDPGLMEVAEHEN